MREQACGHLEKEHSRQREQQEPSLETTVGLMYLRNNRRPVNGH